MRSSGTKASVTIVDKAGKVAAQIRGDGTTTRTMELRGHVTALAQVHERIAAPALKLIR